MNSGQMLLVLFGMIIFGMLSLNVYKSSSSREDTLRTNEAFLNATGLAQSMINEIESKAFDQNTVHKAATSADSLTSPDLLGSDAGETSATQFNDIDDYNNYITTDSLSRLGVYTVGVKVYYIQNMSPDVKSNVQTFSKQVDVSVTNFCLPDTLKLSRVITY